MEFHFNSSYGCQVTERTQNSIANDQREITPKISKVELCMVSVNCFGVRISVMSHFMFVHNTFSSILVTEWPPFGK